MNEMRERGTTLLYVSHSIESVKSVCDHALWVEKGVVRMKGMAEDVCEAYINTMEEA